MTSFVDKIGDLLPILEARGTIYLFALAEREDIDRWDVVLSSDWSDKDSTEAVRFVAVELQSRLKLPEITMVSRIAVIPSSDSRMQEMPESLNGIVPRDGKIIYVSLLGSDIRRAFIFKADHAPVVTQDKSFASASA